MYLKPRELCIMGLPRDDSVALLDMTSSISDARTKAMYFVDPIGHHWIKDACMSMRSTLAGAEGQHVSNSRTKERGDEQGSHRHGRKYLNLDSHHVVCRVSGLQPGK